MQPFKKYDKPKCAPCFIGLKLTIIQIVYVVALLQLLVANSMQLLAAASIKL
jgi:hypothetical protein